MLFVAHSQIVGKNTKKSRFYLKAAGRESREKKKTIPGVTGSLSSIF
jgi:hypothetical protein